MLRFLGKGWRVYWSFLLPLWVWIFSFTAAFGVERFPPPEFEETYQMPVTTAPPPRANYMDTVDVVVLVACLLISSYFVLVKRSRRMIFGLTVFSLAYFGFYRKGCVCAIGSTQDVVLAFFDTHYAVPLTVVLFFLLPLIFTLACGRTFCAAVCPLGAIQDLFLIKPIKTPRWLDASLGLIPFFYLGAAVLFAATGSAFIICRYDPFVSFFRRTGNLNIILWGVVLLAIGIFIGRPYCRFLCPYGAILKVLSKFSRWNVILTGSDCLRCEICDVACPYNAIEDPADPKESNKKYWPKLAIWLCLLPLWVWLGALIGGTLSTSMSMVHPTVSLAERMALEESGKEKEATDASKAFRLTGKPVNDLYAEALSIRKKFETGCWLFGAFCGLVVGIKLASMAIPKTNTEYAPQHGDCVACGRCYSYCPKELSRVKKFQNKKVIPLKPV